MKPGDYLLCYRTRLSRWVGVREVTGEPFFDGAPIWSSRVSRAGLASGSSSRCAPSMGVPVLDMRGELTVFQDLDNPNRWQGPFRDSPTRWKAADGEAVLRALHEAQANPVARPLGQRSPAQSRSGPLQNAAQRLSPKPSGDSGPPKS